MESHDATIGQHSSPVVETMQQLIIAFVLAMTFRGFVAEGFVIPTGSMAPTLMGRHLRITSASTGYEFAIGYEQGSDSVDGTTLRRFVDPNLEYIDTWKLHDTNNLVYPGSAVFGATNNLTPRLGDRIFVLKTLYPFAEPDRFDVVVFKNPTDPVGDAQNYIKRLIGLPDETVWFADGDVFTKPKGGDSFDVRRKPEYVQRAVWQPVHDSDAIVVDTAAFRTQYVTGGRPFPTSPWSSPAWTLDDRVYRTATAEPTTLTWDSERFPITDWNHYNLLQSRLYLLATWPVSDVRVSAGIIRETSGLDTTFTLRARSHVFEFSINETSAAVRMFLADGDSADQVKSSESAITLPNPGKPFTVEFWHVDQALSIFIDGERVVHLEYEWSAEQRMRYATGLRDERISMDDIYDRLARADAERRSLRPEPSKPILSPELSWTFAGTPVSMQRVRVDRDLAYQFVGAISVARRDATRGPTRMAAYGTHPATLAELGPDHFMMAGDNSPGSSDSRLWGEPHPIVETQVDDAAFLVHRKLLLGKAWVVYFPSPQPRSPGGAKTVPDFGALRFIR
jgi:signal peptidase I